MCAVLHVFSLALQQSVNLKQCSTTQNLSNSSEKPWVLISFSLFGFVLLWGQHKVHLNFGCYQLRVKVEQGVLVTVLT